MFICILPQNVSISCIFFFNDTATTEIYTLSLHDALPILTSSVTTDWGRIHPGRAWPSSVFRRIFLASDRKSTRLNSSHQIISYAVFCLKKKREFPPSCWYVGADPPNRRKRLHYLILVVHV